MILQFSAFIEKIEIAFFINEAEIDISYHFKKK
jgi:hypothetical protein